MPNIPKIFIFFFIFFINNSFSQDLDDFKKYGLKDKNYNYKTLEPLYIGNFLSSIVASKNKDYKNFLNFSEKALKTKNNNIELLENAFWANIYLGNINRSLEIISEVELLSDEHDQKFLYPTIVELIRRNELSSAVEISNLLGLEKHNVFTKNMLQTWDYVFKNQKSNAITKLQNYINNTEKNSDLYFFLKVQNLMIYAYFDEYSETIEAFEELQKHVKIIPSRHYINIAKIIYDKIDEKKAKSFLIKNLPENLDLDFVLKNLPKKDIFDPLKLLTNVFLNVGILLRNLMAF